MKTMRELTCNICGNRPKNADEYVNDVEAAIDEEWIPSYYIGQDETGYPVCPDCVRDYMHIEDGEFVANGT